MIIKDTELRGIVLQEFYDRRREDHFSFQGPTDFSAKLKQFDPVDVFRICGQLHDHGLIEWQATRTIGAAMRGGFGSINARGVDVIENQESPSEFQIVFDNSTHTHNTVSGSIGIQIGHSNVQGDISIGKLLAAIDGSSATHEEKAEAKGLLQKFLTNPLVTKVLGENVGKLLPL